MYEGYKSLTLTDDDFCNLYSGLYDFSDFRENEYALLYNTNGELVDKIKYQDGKWIRIRCPVIHSYYGNDIIGRNPQQELAIDMLLDPTPKVKILRGCYGSGKICATF